MPGTSQTFYEELARRLGELEVSRAVHRRKTLAVHLHALSGGTGEVAL